MWGNSYFGFGRVAGLALLAPLTSGCYPDGGLTAMTQSHQVTDSEEAPAGHTCAELSSRGGTGMGSTSDEFWIRESSSRKGMDIEWGSFDEVLGSRSFDRDFFASGEVERFIVTEPDGTEHSYMVWGAHECQRCPEDYEFEALPGDLWGCGTEPDQGDPSSEPTL